MLHAGDPDHVSLKIKYKKVKLRQEHKHFSVNTKNTENFQC